jgi:hypothetical protein
MTDIQGWHVASISAFPATPPALVQTCPLPCRILDAAAVGSDHQPFWIEMDL